MRAADTEQQQQQHEGLGEEAAEVGMADTSLQEDEIQL